MKDEGFRKLSDMFSLKGRTALVTGSARGIGRGIALALAEFGCRVAVHGSKPSGHLDEAPALVREMSPESFPVSANLADRKAVAGLVGELRARDAMPDILVANASVQYRAKWNEITPVQADEQMQVNFHSTLQLVQGFAPRMLEAKWGRIVTVGSVQERRPHPDMAVYAASKGAQENLVRNLAKQFGPTGVTVNNLCPGVFLTDRNREALADPVYGKAVTDVIPLHRYAMPHDAAGAALLLCSDAGRYITGTTILVDGGLSLPK